MNKKLVKKILDAAVMAPSGDNVQPWDFQVSENFTVIKLYNCPEKDDSYYNYQQSASYIAHGAVIENIVIAAEHSGCQTEINLFHDNENPNLIAKIHLTAASPRPTPYYEAIFKRRTNRFPYQPAHITDENIQVIMDSVKNIDTCKISIVNQRDKIKDLAKILMINDQLVFEHQAIHQFLFSKIRWNQQ